MQAITDLKSGVDYVVYSDLLDDDDPDGRIRRVRGNWVVPNLRVLSEEQLLAYENPQFGEECSELSEQAKFAAETIRRLDANGKFANIHY